jgi:hypothetical protein
MTKKTKVELILVNTELLAFSNGLSDTKCKFLEIWLGKG